jgi:hypothetical protein
VEAQMIKPGGLLAACGVLIVLGGTVFYFQKNPSKPESTTPPSPKILTLSEDQVEDIRIVKAGSEPVVLKKLSGKWQITAPSATAADQEAAKTLVSAVSNVTSDRLIDEKPSDLATFGLNSPAIEVDITSKGGKVSKLLLGADTPTGSNTYVKLDGSPKVYTVFSSAKTNFDKTLNDLRDKRLLTFSSDKVAGFSIVSKGPSVEFGKNAQGEWQITKPKPYRADSPQVDDLLRKLKDARMDLAAPPPDFKTADKVGTASVTDNAGTQTIEIRQAKDKTYVAQSSVVDGAFKLAGDLGDGLKDKDADTFRNKKLFDFSFSDPTKVELNGAAYSKAGEKWTGPNGQIDPASIQTVVDKLRDLSAAKFADKFTGTQVLQIAVTSGDKHNVEKVTLNKVTDGYQAQRGDDPSVYVLPASTFDDLQGAVKGIKPYTAPKPLAKPTDKPIGDKKK